MRKTIKILVLILPLLAGCKEAATTQDLLPSDGWTLQREGDNACYQASVPSTVAGTLYDAGYLPSDLFESDNYAEVDKGIFDATWIYSRKFKLSKEPGKHYELCFDGLNYSADIFFNGHQLASADTTAGVFLMRKYDVTPFVKGSNKVEVRLQRAQSRDLNIGFVDWNPRPLDESMGIIRPVHLDVTGSVGIEDVYVKPRLNVEDFSEADVDVMVTLRNHESFPVSGTLNISLQENGDDRIEFSLEGGETREIVLTSAEAPCLHVINPRVWWSHDLGNPELYGLAVSCDVDGVETDRNPVTFGIRKIESRLTEDGYRQFTLNGKDILVTGAGWTDDIFLRDTPGSIERQVKYVRDMNMNCIRFENIWGKDDTVYDLCDRYGLLAMVGWSCQWEWEEYCGIPEKGRYGCIYEPEKEDLALAYFHDQVIRLHNHPSVFAWLTGSDGIPMPELETRYLELFAKYANSEYVCSAKNLISTVSGPSGTKMAGPYEYVGPEYWYDGKAEGGAFGFNTETCTGASIPQIGSLEKMLGKDGIWPISAEWDYHCTASASAMNTTAALVEVVNGYYGEAADFEDFVVKAHAVDYNGTRGMFEAFRAAGEDGTGIIQWMLNSAWPSLYWQLYDWYGVPTAGYYGVKKACEPLQLVFNYHDRKIYGVNATGKSVAVTADVTVYDSESNVMYDATTPVTLEYRSPKAVYNLSSFDGDAHFVSLKLKDADDNVVSDNFYCIGEKDNAYNWEDSEWYVTPITKYSDLGFAFNQGEPDVILKVADVNGGKEVTLVNMGQKIVCMNILSAVDENGELVVPAIWSDNFFALDPGQTKTVTCEVAGDVTIEMLNR